MGEGFAVNGLGEIQPLATGFGQADEFFEPSGASSFEMDASAGLTEGALDQGIDGEFIAAGMNAQLEVRWEAVSADGVGDDGEILGKFLLEACNIADVVHAFVETAAEFRRDGLDGDVLIGNGGEDDEQFGRRLRGIGFVHANFGDEVPLPFERLNKAVNASGIHHGKQEVIGNAGDVIAGDFQGSIDPRNGEGTDQFRVAIDKGFDHLGISGLANGTGDINGEKVAGGREELGGIQVDVVRIDKVGSSPAQLGHGSVGSDTGGGRFRPDGGVFSMRLVPDGNDVDAEFRLCQDAGSELSDALMRKAIAHPEGVFTESEHGVLRGGARKRSLTAEFDPVQIHEAGLAGIDEANEEIAALRGRGERKIFANVFTPVAGRLDFDLPEKLTIDAAMTEFDDAPGSGTGDADGGPGHASEVHTIETKVGPVFDGPRLIAEHSQFFVGSSVVRLNTAMTQADGLGTRKRGDRWSPTIQVGGFQNEHNGFFLLGEVFGHGDLKLALKAAENGVAGILPERQDPLHHLARLLDPVLGMGNHGNRSPDAAGAFDNALGGTIQSLRIAAILVGDFQVGGANEAAVDHVTVEAIARFHDFEAGRQGFGAGEGGPGVLEATGNDAVEELDPVGNGLGVFGIGHGDVPGDGLIEVEEIAILRRSELHLRRIIPDQNGERGGGRSAVLILGRHRDLPGTDRIEGQGWVRLIGDDFVFVPGQDTPLIADGVSGVRVHGSFAGELNRERWLACGSGSLDDAARGAISPDVVDPDQLAIVILAPGFAVLDEVERAFGAEVEVDGAGEAVIRHEFFHRGDLGIAIQLHAEDPVARPLIDKESVVEGFGEFDLAVEIGIEVINGSGAGSPAAGPKQREVFRLVAVIVDEGRLSGRKNLFSLAVGRDVARSGRVFGFANFAGFEVDIRVGEIWPDEIGPAEVSGNARLVHFIVTGRTAISGRARVGPDIAPIEIAGFLIDTDAPGIATSHDINLRDAVRAVFGEQIAVGDLVGSISEGTNAEHFAIVAELVGRGFLSIPGHAVGALVNGGKAFGIAAGMGVVPRGDEEAAVRAELEGAGVMTTLKALFLELEETFFRGEVKLIAPHREAADVLAGEVRRRVLQVNPLIPGEIRIEGDSDQAILLSGGDLQLACLDDLLGRGIEDAEFATELDEKDPTIRGDFQLHRSIHLHGQGGGSEARGLEDFCCGDEGKREGGSEEERGKRLHSGKNDGIFRSLPSPKRGMLSRSSADIQMALESGGICRRVNGVTSRFFRFALVLSFASAGFSVAADPFQREMEPFLEAYCIQCHDEDSQKGDVELTPFATLEEVQGDRKLWLKVLHQLETREMPTKKPLPSEAEYEAMIAWIQANVNNLDYRALNHPGRVTIPRLTKLEYNRTVRDLLGIDYDVATKFSEDGQGDSGFTNDRDALFITPGQMEKYFEAAEKAVGSLVEEKVPRLVTMLESEDMFMTESRSVTTQQDDAVGYVLNRGQMTLYDSVEFPVSGVYEFRVRAWTTGGPTGARLRINDEVRGDIAVPSTTPEVIVLRTFAEKGYQQIAWNIQKPGGTALAKGVKSAASPKKANYTVLPEDANAIVTRESGQEAPGWPITPDLSQEVRAAAQRANSSAGSVQRPYEWLNLHGENGNPHEIIRFRGYIAERSIPLHKHQQELARLLGLSREQFEQQWREQNPERIARNEAILKLGAHVSPRAIKELRDATARSQPPGNVGIDWIEVAGPVRPEGMESNLFVAKPGPELSDRAAAQHILEHIMPRAFRRPVEAVEVAKYLGLFEQSQAIGDDFYAAMRQTLSAVLVSPNFLFRVELAPSKANEPFALTDYQLASRLSYLFWMSLPDDELRELAEAGKLRDPEVLRGQVDRMLADPRSRIMSEEFLGQWLGFAGLGSTHKPDIRAFRQVYTDELGEAMRMEPVYFFRHLLAENKSLLGLLDARETFVNQALAKLYGISSAPGVGFERVALQDPNRGGLLGMSGILTSTSTPTRTSPVIRGAWVVERLLGEEIPTPPADAGTLPANAGTKAKTLREELSQHREREECAGCHDRIDPIGFGLENFDAIGRWRDVDEQKRAIDASGDLPGGITFSGPVELKAYLLEHRQEDFVRTVIEKMLAYALGRELQLFDQPAVEDILAALAENGYGTKTLMQEIVLSRPFLYQAPKAEL